MTQPPPERDDLDALMGPLIEFAQEMLGKHGEFHPFGNVMSGDGSVSLFAADSGGEHPSPDDVLDILIAGMRARAEAGEIGAAGICYDARIGRPNQEATDAIVIGLEHRLGDAVKVYLPYSKSRFTGIRYGELMAGPGERRVFRDDSSA